MVQFRIKKLYVGHVVDDWIQVHNIETRSHVDFVFSYCEYKIGDDIYTVPSPEFIEAFKKEKFWKKLVQ